MTVTTLLPPFITKFHPTFNNLEIGFLLAAWQISFTIFSPVVGSQVNTFGYKNAILFSIQAEILSALLFSLAPFISNSNVFYTFNFIARLIEGIADNTCVIVVSSVLTIEQPDNASINLGYVHIYWALGLMLGPIICSILFNFIGYQLTFIAMICILILLGLIPNVVQLPDSLNTKYLHKETDDVEGITRLSYFDFLMSYRSLTTLIICALSITPLIWIDAILVNALIDKGLSNNIAGLGFAINCLFQGIGALVTGQLSDIQDRRLCLLFNFVICGVSNFLCGPSLLFSLPDNIQLTFVGLSLLGFATSGVFIPIIPELINGVSCLENVSSTVTEMNDKASSVFQLGLGLGFTAAPIMAGLLNDVYGQRRTTDILAVFTMILSLIQFFVYVFGLMFVKGQKWKNNENE